MDNPYRGKPISGRKKAQLVFGAVILALAAAVCASLTPPEPLPFEAVKWQRFHSHSTGVGMHSDTDVTRARMLDSLLRERLKPGLEFEEGRRLLGEPEGEGGHAGPPPWQDDHYALSYGPFLPPLWLKVRFGKFYPGLCLIYERGRLVKAEIE